MLVLHFKGLGHLFFFLAHDSGAIRLFSSPL